MARAPSLRHNILYNIAGQAIVMLLSLVSTHLVFHKLGSDVLGVIYFAVTATFVLITLSDMGLSPTITREVAAHRDDDRKYVSDLIGTTSLLAWATFVVSCGIIVALAPFLISHWLTIGGINQERTVAAFVWISVSLLLAIPRSVYGAVICGNERMGVWNLTNVATVGIQQFGMIAVLAAGGDIDDVAVWYVISAIGGITIFVVMAARVSPISPVRIVWCWPVIKKNLHFGSHLFANSVMSYLVGQADKWIVSKLLPASHLGYYGVAQGLVSKGGAVPTAIAVAAYPTLSTGVMKREHPDWMSQYHKLQDFCSYVYVPVAAAVAMLGIIVMTYVLNEEAVRKTWLALVFLSIGQLLLGLQNVPYMLSLAMKRAELSLRANVQTLLIAAPAAVALTYVFGLDGAAASTILSGGLYAVFFIPKFSNECLKVSGWQWFRMTGFLFLLGLLAYGIPWSILWFIDLGLSFYGLIAAYLVGSAIFLIFGWVAVGSELKGLIREQLMALGIKLRIKAA